MSYEAKPNEATLWENRFKTTDAHPTKKGQLLITRQLLLDLCEQQGKGGDFLVDVSAWERLTATGKQIINIKIEKPFKFGEQPPAPSEERRYKAGTPPEYQAPRAQKQAIAHQPAPAKPQYTAEDIARGKLKKFKAMLEACKNLQEVIDLDHQLHEPERWKYFGAVAIVANEAQDLLEEYKEKFIPKEPTDHSDLIAKIDTQFQRLGLPPKAHCLARWNKSRAMLTAQELQIYLDELAIAEPVPPPSDDFF